MAMKTFDENIPNKEIYNSRMEKSMEDKLFFLEHIDADIYIDYGCANGALIKTLAQLYPNKYFIGFDISSSMINEAKENCKGLKSHILFTTNWDSVLTTINFFKIHKPQAKTCLCCSSVLHEIYSYSPYKDIFQFWDRFWESGFDYITVRDMYHSFPTDNNYVLSIKDRLAWTNAIMNSKYKDKFQEYLKQEHICQISEANSLKHFLLKYFYEENWERELKEDYIPSYPSSLLLKSPQSAIFSVGYVRTFVETYTLPYLQEKIRQDFGLNYNCHTHYKIILTKTE